MHSSKFSRALASPRLEGEPSYDLCQPAWMRMQVKEAWELIVRAKRQSIDLRRIPRYGITVAIIDWGIQKDHKAFKEQDGQVLISGIRVIPPLDSDDFSDDDGHGTLLAGTIAALANGLGTGGRALPPVKLLAVKFIDVLTPPMSTHAATAIKCATKRGARVINASWDVGFDNPELKDAITKAGDDVVVVVAAGNDGSNNDNYPAFPASFRLPNIISVMAIDTLKEGKSDYDVKPGFSNYGKESVDIAAPGVDIVSTSPHLVRRSRDYNSAFRSYSGTSAAAAQVSGAAAVLLSLKPNWKAEDVRNCLMRSADRLPGLDKYCRCGGRLNLREAVKAALSE